MDRKAFLIITVSAILLITWPALIRRLYPPSPESLAGTNAVTLVTSPTNAPSPAAIADNPAPQIMSASGEAVPGIPSDDETLLTLENEAIRFRITSHGGGIRSIDLLAYPQSSGCADDDPEKAILPTVLNLGAPAPVLMFDNWPQLEGTPYQLSTVNGGVKAERTLTNGLHVTKEFLLGTNFIIRTKVRLENRGVDPISLPPRDLVVGTAVPLATEKSQQIAESRRMGIHWYDGDNYEKVGDSWFANRTLGCIPGTPRDLYTGGNGNVMWVGANHQFFTIAALLPTNAPAAQMRARRRPVEKVEGAIATTRNGEAAQAFQGSLVYPGEVLVAGATWESELDIYAGPKEYKSLARIGHQRQNGIEQLMDFGFFGFFSKALLLSMNGLHSLGLAYGLAIVVITIIIKLLFWPLTQASMRSMKRMGALQPQMQAIREKYKEDPQKLNRKMMEYMKENKVNPMGGCLPILLQIPVFIGFFYMIQSAIELRGASFLWACDLSRPDTLFTIPGLNFPFNLLPLLMGTTQLLQMRMTPPSPGMDPAQQKIMQYMPLIFVVFLYNFASGLTLYWTVQNLLSIVQMKLMKKEPLPAAAAAAAVGGSVTSVPARPTTQVPPVRRKRKKR